MVWAGGKKKTLFGGGPPSGHSQTASLIALRAKASELQPARSTAGTDELKSIPPACCGEQADFGCPDYVAALDACADVIYFSGGHGLHRDTELRQQRTHAMVSRYAVDLPTGPPSEDHG